MKNKALHIGIEAFLLANRKALAKDIARLHERISNLRDDWQWKLAHELCRKYDTLCIEDLNIDGMKRLWGARSQIWPFRSS